jgi:hypothetical protein
VHAQVTPIADMIERMAAGGVPMEFILLAVRTAELSAEKSGGIPVDTAAEKRRAWDRERKASKRNSTGHSTGIPPDNGSALSFLESKGIKKEEQKKERKRGEKIPPDWKPNVGHVAAGQQLGFTEPQIREQAEDMRLWAQSNDHRAVARKSDWDMTFLSWLRRNKPKQNGHFNGKRNPTMAAIDDLIARAEGGEVAGAPPMRDISPRST